MKSSPRNWTPRKKQAAGADGKGEEAEALSTETLDFELQYQCNTDLCKRLGSSGQAQLGEGVLWKLWNNTQEDGARRAPAGVADAPTGAPRPASPETRAKAWQAWCCHTSP